MKNHKIKTMNNNGKWVDYKEPEYTKVLYLKHPESDEVMAFFPELSTYGCGKFFDSYEHTGQHSACHINYAKECEILSKWDASELIYELTKIGYNLESYDSFGYFPHLLS